MLYFALGILILIVGYFSYVRFVERIFAPDDRVTPAFSKHDDVDFVELPLWKNMLIQLLNIAGTGPVIGVILGIKFGAIVFLIIPIGNIIGGAVHDFASGMLSLRNGGANLPSIINKYLGRSFGDLFGLFLIVVLLMVIAVFINVPSGLIESSLGAGEDVFWWSVIVIFGYFVAATLLPIDKIIGNLYPYFGGLLLIGTMAILVTIVFKYTHDHTILTETSQFLTNKYTAEKMPLLPMLFVTISCGILSGFHASQSPLIARTLKTERHARKCFYGMMVAEGIIAMIWAAAALVIYNMTPELMGAKPTPVLYEISNNMLGSWAGHVTVISVIILSITSGDTALRIIRLDIAEKLKIDQKKLFNRFIICAPLILIIITLLWWSNQNANSFNQLWNYFSWSNQILAAVTLAAATVYLSNKGGYGFIITLIPGVFITFITISYICWISPAHGGPLGFGLTILQSYIIAAIVAIFIGIYTVYRGKKVQLK